MSAVPFLLNASPSELLKTGAADLDALLTSAARARLTRGTDALPLPARTLCLECRLDQDERVDLALCLATHTAGLAPAIQLLSDTHAHDVEWQLCLRLLMSWVRQEDRALAAVPFLYTAFDLGDVGTTTAVPCLSLCADASFFMRRLGLPVPRAPRASVLRLLDACRSLLEADWLDASLVERCRKCLEVPADLEVRQLSLMLARRPPTLKLDVSLPRVELARFLATTGWRGDAVNLDEQLKLLAPWQQRAQLNYVINSDSDESPLEIELCCTGPDEPSPTERTTLLQELVRQGLVDTTKAQALCHLLKCPVIDADGHWVGRNWYLKLRFEAGQFVSAKAYIGLMQRSAKSPAAQATVVYEP